MNFAIEPGYSKQELEFPSNHQILLRFDVVACFFNFPHARKFVLHLAVNQRFVLENSIRATLFVA